MTRLRSITVIALLAIGAAFAVPAAAIAGPAEEEYKLDYPDAKGGKGSKDDIVVGPRGASAKGLDEDSATGAGGGKGSGGGGGGSDGSGGGAEDGLGAAAATSANSDTVPEIAAENADSSFTSGGLPILILILAATAAGALGYLAWRRNQAQ